MTLHFAYGSNMSRALMATRCRGAEAIGTATLPGLKDRVTELTGFASMVVNPFDNMKLGGAVRESKLRREAPSYLTACGLAMRRFLQ